MRRKRAGFGWHVLTGVAVVAIFSVIIGCGGGGDSLTSTEGYVAPTASLAAYSQSDLAGVWDGIIFFMGSEMNWIRVVWTVDSSGSITVNSDLDAGGNSIIAPPGSFSWTIAADGIVTSGGLLGYPSFRGQMSSNKLLIIGKKGDTSGTSAALTVFRKRTGTSFSDADLANKTFTLHQLSTGTDNNWYYGAGTTDGSRQVTLTSAVSPSGPQTPGSAGIVSVNSSGIVTESGNASFYGLMTDDKKVIFVSKTDSHSGCSFMVVTITGQTYVQSDLAGTFNFVAIRNSSPYPGWAYGSYSMDAAGSATYLAYTDIAGNPAPAGFSRVVSSSGVTTDPADVTHHGQLSYNKDLGVRTNTNAYGRHGLTIAFR